QPPSRYNVHSSSVLVWRKPWPGRSDGSGHRFVTSSEPPISIATRWSSSVVDLDSGSSPYARIAEFFTRPVFVAGGRTVAVQPRTQIVAPMLAWVTAGLTEP